MQSRNEDFSVELEEHGTFKSKPKSFELYEEYSQRDIGETIQRRKDAYEKANLQTGEELETEIENFRVWLESVKKFAPPAAHYYSVSLKSMLLGLPIGIQIAKLFDVVLEKLDI
ncbi:MAG TPA: hypothetical protein VMS94_04075 [Acidobacteriota bacterium]|jgi:hypothetical protein|nr:hypothetical protein [Acidobacteriota bacterium]